MQKRSSDWQKLPPGEKVKWLNAQLDDIRRTRALIERFERVARKWLRSVEVLQAKSTENEAR